MKLNGREILTPQLEEGITDAVFKNKEDSVRALQNSYKNINSVFKAFLPKSILKNDPLISLIRQALYSVFDLFYYLCRL